MKPKTIQIFLPEGPPPTASTTASGRSSNGWAEWRDKNGKTLDEVMR